MDIYHVSWECELKSWMRGGVDCVVCPCWNLKVSVLDLAS